MTIPDGALSTLKRALAEGGAIMLRHFRRTGYRLKSPGNLVTIADLESQRAIVTRILRRFPDHHVIAEEGDGDKGEGPAREGFTWVIDPLDGTTNYAHGFPVAVVSIALLRGDTPILGGVHDPFRGETFLARRGRGATMNGARLSVSATPRLKESLLVTGFPYDRVSKAEFYVGYYARMLKLTHDVRRTGAAALDLAWVAAGRLDGFWEFKLKPWDVAAGKLLVEEAGGKVTDFEGRPWKRLAEFGGETLATNGRIHNALARVLAQR